MESTKTPKLAPLAVGDIVRLVSPASLRDEADVQSCLTFLAGLGLKPQVGAYALDRYGYLAGRDEDRLADLNDAIRDQTVRAIIATRGGKGAYRIADGVDFAAIRANPKVLIGFSEITILHLAIWKQCSVPGIHGAAWSPVQSGETSSRSFETAISSTEDTLVHSHEGEPTTNLTTSGKVTGTLIGGQPIKTVAAMLAFDGRIEPVQRRKMLSPCRGLDARLEYVRPDRGPEARNAGRSHASHAGDRRRYR